MEALMANKLVWREMSEISSASGVSARTCSATASTRAWLAWLSASKLRWWSASMATVRPCSPARATESADSVCERSTAATMRSRRCMALPCTRFMRPIMAITAFSELSMVACT